MRNNRLRNKAGHVETLYLTAIIGITAGLVLPAIHLARAPKVAQRYAIERYGDHKAPLTIEERVEWYQDMGVEYGKKPTSESLDYFNENCRHNVFF